MKVKRQNGSTDTSRPKSYSLTSRETHTSQSTRAGNIAAQREVRTLPSWIDSFEEGLETHAHNQPSGRRLATPPKSHNAHHNSSPAKPERRISKDGYEDSDDELSGIHEKAPERGLFGGHKEPEKGRKWDHAREHTPVIMQNGPDSGAESWKTFVKASMYGPGLADEGKRVDEKFLQELTPGYQQPWRGDAEGDDVENGLGLLHLHNRKQRRKWYLRIQVRLLCVFYECMVVLTATQNILLMHPLVPLFFRMIVLTTSTVALGLSGSVFKRSVATAYNQDPSTYMAIIVDVVALPYICYITFDEYVGKPLGLRSPRAKMRLILLDLLFIVFESANLALAFDALRESNGSCTASVQSSRSPDICDRAKALVSFLFIGLVAWIATFNISIFR